MWTKDAILNGIKTSIEKRSRIRARAQIGPKPNASFRVNVTSHGKVGRAAERLIVRIRETKTLLARTAERRC